MNAFIELVNRVLAIVDTLAKRLGQRHRRKSDEHLREDPADWWQSNFDGGVRDDEQRAESADKTEAQHPEHGQRRDKDG